MGAHKISLLKNRFQSWALTNEQIVGIKVAHDTSLNSLRRELNMEIGEYYMSVETNRDPNGPTLILGYIVDGEKVEIYKNLGTYIVVNTKTEKWLTCLGYEHAHHVFSECVRTLTPEGEA